MWDLTIIRKISFCRFRLELVVILLATMTVLLDVARVRASSPPIQSSSISGKKEPSAGVQHRQLPQSSYTSGCSEQGKLRGCWVEDEDNAWGNLQPPSTIHRTLLTSYIPHMGMSDEQASSNTLSPSVPDTLLITAATIGVISTLGILAFLLYILVRQCLASSWQQQSTLTHPLLPTTHHTSQEHQAQGSGAGLSSLLLLRKLRPSAAAHQQLAGAGPPIAGHPQARGSHSSAAIPGLTPLPGSSDSEHSPTPPEVSTHLEPPSLVETPADRQLSRAMGHTLPHDLVTPAIISMITRGDTQQQQPQATGLRGWLQWVRGKVGPAQNSTHGPQQVGLRTAASASRRLPSQTQGVPCRQCRDDEPCLQYTAHTTNPALEHAIACSHWCAV
jgi:hypothetical protein